MIDIVVLLAVERRKIAGALTHCFVANNYTLLLAVEARCTDNMVYLVQRFVRKFARDT